MSSEISPKQPALSYILVTDVYDTIRGVVDRVRRQTIADQIELVLAAPDPTALKKAEAHRGEFANLIVLEHPADHLAPARAAGIRAATAPLVFIGETHSYPHPGLAEALLAHAKDSWSVLVPGFGNANPNGPFSQAAFLLDYGGWLAGMTARQISEYPIYNAAFRRSTLMRLGESLDLALDHGDQMWVALRANGDLAYHEPTARLDHVNVTPVKHWLRERFISGMLIARHRSTDWSFAKRALYVAASPLIPFVLLKRILPGLKAAGRSGMGATVLSLMALGTVIKVAGEALVYAGGWTEQVEDEMLEYELHRLAYAGPGAS